MKKYSWYTIIHPDWNKGEPPLFRLVGPAILPDERTCDIYFKPNMKGGHTHNHVKNAHKRMKKCNICGKPITKYEGFSSRFMGHICMECYIEECREHAVMAGIPTIGSLFDELRNPYIRCK